MLNLYENDSPIYTPTTTTTAAFTGLTATKNVIFDTTEISAPLWPFLLRPVFLPNSFSISELIECVPFDNKRLRCVLVVGRGFTRHRHLIFVDDSYFCGLLIQTKLLDINGKYSNSRITAITIIINI